MVARGPLRAALEAVPLRGDPATARDGSLVRDPTVSGEPARLYLVRVHGADVYFLPVAPELAKDLHRCRR